MLQKNFHGIHMQKQIFNYQDNTFYCDKINVASRLVLLLLSGFAVSSTEGLTATCAACLS